MARSSIIIPHYRTPDHLELCLRCIARFTEEPHEVIVVDNGSDETVLEGLRKRDDLVLVERVQDAALDQNPHKAALDAGIERSEGDTVVGIHSDTFVHRRGWLGFLIERLEQGGYLAYGPTSHRLYPPSVWESLKARVRPKPEDRRWIRPVFTIYRREFFADRRFADYDDVGEITASAAAEGRVGFLDRREAARWAFHSGGTTKLALLDHRRRARRRKERHFRAFAARKEIRELLPGR